METLNDEILDPETPTEPDSTDTPLIPLEPSNELKDSILNDIKSALNINLEDTSFDKDLIIFINSVFSTLLQLGVIEDPGYKIESVENLWSEIIKPDNKEMESMKEYVYLKVKLIFDPPQSSYGTNAIKEVIKEHEWRLNWLAETNKLKPIPLIPLVPSTPIEEP